MFLLFRKACLLYKTSKIVFTRFIFTIYDIGKQGVTTVYMGLQGVTWGTQRVTGGYRGLQGLQGVTGGERGLQGAYKGL